MPEISEIDAIKRLADTVDGWLRDAEGKLLYALAKNCPGRGVIVEIGSFKGKSTIWLGKGSKAGTGVPVYAIDPHDGSGELREMRGAVWSFDDFKANLVAANVDDIVVPLVQKSEQAARSFKKPVELIFVDGDHEYSRVLLDFQLWFPKLLVGGIMAFHDADAPGPWKVVKDLVIKSAHFRNIRFVDSILVAQKVSRISLIDRMRNRCQIVLRSRYLPDLLRALGRRLVERGNDCMERGRPGDAGG